MKGLKISDSDVVKIITVYKTTKNQTKRTKALELLWARYYAFILQYITHKIKNSKTQFEEINNLKNHMFIYFYTALERYDASRWHECKFQNFMIWYLMDGWNKYIKCSGVVSINKRHEKIICTSLTENIKATEKPLHYNILYIDSVIGKAHLTKNQKKVIQIILDYLSLGLEMRNGRINIKSIYKASGHKSTYANFRLHYINAIKKLSKNKRRNHEN